MYILLAVNTFNTLQFAMSSVMRGVGHTTWSVMTQVIGAFSNIISSKLLWLSRKIKEQKIHFVNAGLE